VAQAGISVQLPIPEIYQALRCSNCKLDPRKDKCPLSKKRSDFRCPLLTLRDLVRSHVTDELVDRVLGPT